MSRVEADDDLGEPLLQIIEIAGEAEDRHDFGGNRDIEAAFAREAVCGATECDDDLAQRAIVHIDDAAEIDAARVDLELIAPIEMIVDHRREQIMRRGNRMEIASEVEVDRLHRHHLRIAAAGSAALHAEAGAERGLAQSDDGLLADDAQRIGKADGGRRLAFARRGRIDGGDEDQFALRPGLGLFMRLGEKVEIDLRDLGAVRLNRIRGNARAFGNCADRFNLGGTCNLDVARHSGGPRPFEFLLRFFGVYAVAAGSALSCIIRPSAKRKRPAYKPRSRARRERIRR